MTAAQKPAGSLPHLMKKVLGRLKEYESLSYREAKEVLTGITAGMVNDSQVAAFITAFLMRHPTIEELCGFRDALLEQAMPLCLPAGDAIDIVGTGGDGKHTFNISTLSAFVVAACGYRVIKHGNYAASSVSGSSDVLEYLGYRFTADEGMLNRQLEQCGLCFLHAPLFHPGMKRMASIRRNLGLRTFFNVLGPLINPARPGFLLLGAGSAELARMFHYILQDSTVTYRIIHAQDGYDELSLTGPARIYTRVTDQVVTPEGLGLQEVPPAALSAGKDVKSAAAVFLQVLKHSKAATEQQEVVIANSAMALQCLNADLATADCMDMARAALLSGKAYEIFSNIIQTY